MCFVVLFLCLYVVLLSTRADRQGVDISLTVCVFVCFFVRLRISPPKIKLAAWRQIFQGSSSASQAGNLPFWGSVLSQKLKIGRIGQRVNDDECSSW